MLLCKNWSAFMEILVNQLFFFFFFPNIGLSVKLYFKSISANYTQFLSCSLSFSICISGVLSGIRHKKESEYFNFKLLTVCLFVCFPDFLVFMCLEMFCSNHCVQSTSQILLCCAGLHHQLESFAHV